MAYLEGGCWEGVDAQVPQRSERITSDAFLFRKMHAPKLRFATPRSGERMGWNKFGLQ